MNTVVLGEHCWCIGQRARLDVLAELTEQGAGLIVRDAGELDDAAVRAAYLYIHVKEDEVARLGVEVRRRLALRDHGRGSCTVGSSCTVAITGSRRGG